MGSFSVEDLIGVVLVVGGFIYLVKRGRAARLREPAATADVPRTPRARSMATLQKLEKLKQLHTSGALSDAEYEAEKAKVLR